jgi:outer membrane protein insertion porin family
MNRLAPGILVTLFLLSTTSSAKQMQSTAIPSARGALEASVVTQFDSVVRGVASAFRQELPSAGLQTAGLQTPQTDSVTTSTAPQGGPIGGTMPTSLLQGYRLGQIRVIGVHALPTEAIKEWLGLVPGKVYDESKFHKGLQDVKNFYGTGGWATFQLQPVFDIDEERKILNLTVNIDQGLRYFLRSISFTGNTTVPDAVLRREIRLTEGFAFNAKLLEASLPRLNQLGFFEEIKIQDFMLTPHPDEAKLDVVLRVKEKRR